jgi:hypothetical protein
MLPIVFAPWEEEAELWDLGLKSESASLPHPELAAAQRSHVVACAPRPRYNAHAPDHRRLRAPPPSRRPATPRPRYIQSRRCDASRRRIPGHRLLPPLIRGRRPLHLPTACRRRLRPRGAHPHCFRGTPSPGPVSRLAFLIQRVLAVAAAARRVSTSDSASIQIRVSGRWLPDEHCSDFRH